MGSYISPKIRAKSCGSSTGLSLVVSFFNDCLIACRSDEAKSYVESCRMAVERGTSHDELPPDSLSISDFDISYQCYNFCRKTRMALAAEPLSADSMNQTALQGFLAQETANEYLNKNKFIPGWSASAELNNLSRPEQVIHLARLKIANLLGYDFDLNEFSTKIGFSSGSSTRLPRRRGAAPYKFQGKPHVTRNCALLALNLIHYHEPWRLYCQNRFGRESDPFSWVKIVRGSEYFTVPKTATTVRGAAKEPELNMLCQKAIGTMIRERLRRVGVDLRDQSRNRDLARYGSESGLLATIDLSAASDSISLECLDLLPPSWARFITMTRSEEIKLLDGTWHPLQMVSSMGNGFTFELESLIFWALAKSATDLDSVLGGYVSVYGDDIIVPTDAADTLIHTLGYLGFATNTKKTFATGPFRESCGGHYLYGSDVTPFYLRDSLKNQDDYYLFCNSFNLWAWRHPSVPWTNTLRWIRKNRPRHVCYSIEDYGLRSGIFVADIGHADGVYFCLRKQAYITRVHKELREQCSVSGEHGYLAWLLQPGGEVQVLHEKKGVRKYASRVSLSRWPNTCVRFGNLFRAHLEPL